MIVEPAWLQDTNPNCPACQTRIDHARLTNIPFGGTFLASIALELWTRTALERSDRNAATAPGKADRSWDAVAQLIRYADVVGRKIPLSAQSIQSGELFVETPPGHPASQRSR